MIAIAVAPRYGVIARMAAQLLHLTRRHIAVAPAGLLAFAPSRRTSAIVTVVIAITVVVAVMVAVAFGVLFAIVAIVVGKFCAASAVRIAMWSFGCGQCRRERQRGGHRQESEYRVTHCWPPTFLRNPILLQMTWLR